MSAPHISLARRAVEKGKDIPPLVARRLLRGGRVFITIDDGPLGAFEEILRVLDSHGATATFFLVGSRITAENLPLVHRALMAGHRIGNHSWSHLRFSDIGPEQMEEQIVRAHEVLDGVLREAGGSQGPEERYFRFPHLDSGFQVRADGSVLGHPSKRAAAYRVLQQLKYRVFQSNVDSYDWAIEYGKNSVEGAVGRTLRAKRGDIIMMHDTPSAPAILERVLPELTRKWAASPLTRGWFL